MVRPKIPFALLRQLLLNLGFREVVVPASHIGFRHAETGAEIVLPTYRGNQHVAPRHLLLVRLTLDAKGLMDGDEFDAFVASRSVQQSVS
jgi:predicted RNA binding protein YcfA (HicA-like mRNA interferase family)